MKKHIVLAAQNETVRSSADVPTSLATFGLLGCVAVLIKEKDARGGASLTHVDSYTNLDFIKREISLMSGEFTIDIISDTTNPSDLPTKVSRYLKQNFAEIKNSKGNNDIRKTQQGAVLCEEDRILKLNFRFIEEHLIRGCPISAENPFKKELYKISNGDDKKPFQARIYDQQIPAYLRPNEERMPDVVFDGKNWSDNMFQLPDDLKKERDDLLKISGNPMKLFAAIKESCAKNKINLDAPTCPSFLKERYLSQFPALLVRMNRYQQASSGKGR